MRRPILSGLTLAALAAGAVAAQPVVIPPPQEQAPVPAPKPAGEPAASAPDQGAAPAPSTAETEAPQEESPEDDISRPPAAPQRRARYDVAVLQALDKVTAESMRFEARVGQPVRYKTLIFTVKACERAAPDEPIDDSVAYVTIDSQPKVAPGGAALPPKQAFKGWMYASSPGLHPLEHPVYDAWLITCRATVPLIPAAPPAPLPRPATQR